MDKILRKNLDQMSQDMLSVMYNRYWMDSDDSDLFLDVVMQWLQNTFGVGEILEYISIGFEARKSDTKAMKTDNKNVAELLNRVIEYLPPHESNCRDLFGEESSPKEKKRFNELWNCHKSNKTAFLESVQDEIEKIKCGRDAQFLVDVMQIWIADVYHIEEDLEALKHKYGVKDNSPLFPDLD